MPIFGTHINYRVRGETEINRVTFTEPDHGEKAGEFSAHLIQIGRVDFLELHPFQLKDENDK